jgi:HK97 family phage portal protein
MGVLDLLKSAKAAARNYRYAKVMNGMTPVFSNFGTDVYVSDIVKNAIRCIGTEMSKLEPKHIMINPGNGLQTVVNDEITRLLEYGPNPLMTTTDFMTKIVYMREKYNNVYIYPTWTSIQLPGGKYKRKYTGFYPLNPLNVDYLEDEKGTLWIKFYFANGYEYTMKYADVIHWRKDYTENEFQGGDINGRPDNRSELKLLETDDVITQGISKGVKISLGVTGILKVNTMLDDEKQEEERRAFEEKINNSKSGLLATDLKSEFVPTKIDPKVIDKETVSFIIERILANYGVSSKIFYGNFTDEEYQAFYEKTLEPLIISLGRAFSRVIFTEKELELGHKVIFYNQALTFTSTKNKIEAVKVLTGIGVLTDNQVLAIFGYPPFDGGDIRHMSLNYINRDIADQYQLSKTGKGKETEKNE